MQDSRDSDVEHWLDSLDVDPAKARDGRHVRRISAAVRALGVGDAEVIAAVIAAGEAGHSWGIIGVALGVSRQAAQARYGEAEGADSVVD